MSHGDARYGDEDALQELVDRLDDRAKAWDLLSEQCLKIEEVFRTARNDLLDTNGVVGRKWDFIVALAYAEMPEVTP